MGNIEQTASTIILGIFGAWVIYFVGWRIIRRATQKLNAVICRRACEIARDHGPEFFTEEELHVELQRRSDTAIIITADQDRYYRCTFNGNRAGIHILMQIVKDKYKQKIADGQL